MCSLYLDIDFSLSSNVWYKLSFQHCFYVEWIIEYQRAVRMPAQQPGKVSTEIMSFMKHCYMLKRRKCFWWHNWCWYCDIMKWWCNTVWYKSLTVSMYRGQWYDVTHWIKSYTNSSAILITYHIYFVFSRHFLHFRCCFWTPNLEYIPVARINSINLDHLVEPNQQNSTFFKLSEIIEGTTEKVSKCIMLLKSIGNKKTFGLINSSVSLNTAERIKQ